MKYFIRNILAAAGLVSGEFPHVHLFLQVVLQYI